MFTSTGRAVAIAKAYPERSPASTTRRGSGRGWPSIRLSDKVLPKAPAYVEILETLIREWKECAECAVDRFPQKVTKSKKMAP